MTRDLRDENNDKTTTKQRQNFGKMSHKNGVVKENPGTHNVVEYSKHNVPVYAVNSPGAGVQQPVVMHTDTPIYSSYTSEFVGYGHVPKGTPGDAPYGHPNYGKNFHVIQHVASERIYMIHRMGGRRR